MEFHFVYKIFYSNSISFDIIMTNECGEKMKSIYDLTIEQMQEDFKAHEDKKFYANQLFEWLYQKKITDFNQATNIKQQTRERLMKEYRLDTLKIVTVEKDKDVSKYLFALNDKEHIEAVLMYHDYGNSLCISSQVGCNMGCAFCESGRRKKVRNLQTSEMVEQILKVEQESNCRISHVVIMGIGEPFDNYDNIIHFIDIINHPKGLAIGARHITISTCGIVPKIKEFTNYDKQVNLAISLHAPTDELRKKIMPIDKVYPLKELLPALKEYSQKTNRRLTFEYIMLKDVNDHEQDALDLAKLLKGMNAYVNLIPYNETENLQFERSSTIQIAKFYDILKENKICVTIRREFGGKISAACGQLRSKKEEV